jgi:arginase
MQIALIGAPTDVGAGARGASMGPEALRVAQIQQMLEAQGLDVVDRGNLSGPPNRGSRPVEGYRHPARGGCVNQLVHDAMHDELRGGRMPILLGGDHSLAIGSISAVARHCRAAGRKLRVLWFDAHADFNTNVLTPSGNVHGMPVACLCGYGPAELVTIGGHRPMLDPRDLRQIGIRSVDAGEKRLVHEVGFEVFDMRYIDEMGIPSHAGTRARRRRRQHAHPRQLDVDFLDPDIAPGVGTTVPGGPTYREAQLCMEMVADTGRLGSLGHRRIESGLRHVRNRTAEVAVDLIGSLFGKEHLDAQGTGRSAALALLLLLRLPPFSAPAPAPALSPVPSPFSFLPSPSASAVRSRRFRQGRFRSMPATRPGARSCRARWRRRPVPGAASASAGTTDP